MTILPGQGIGTAHSTLLGAGLAADTTNLLYEVCRVFGNLKNSEGNPVGKEVKTLVNGPTGMVAVNSWRGVAVSCQLAVADGAAGIVFTTEKSVRDTDSSGRFAFKVLQGATAVITCPVFGKTVTVDTTAQTAINISTYF